MEKQPTMVMLVGLPYSGKSHFIDNSKLTKDYTRLSTDMFIQRIAEAVNLSYNKIFRRAFKVAEMAMEAELQRAVEAKENIVFDQTNLTKVSRGKKLAKIPAFYRKVAVFLPELEEEELKKRMQQRSSHFVPMDIIETMADTIEEPEQDEGFDVVYIVGMDDSFIGKEF